MVTIDAIRKPIETELDEFDGFVRSQMRAESGLLAEMLDYILSSRGKGIRPVIAMLSAAINSPTGRIGRRTHLAAMLVEMIHVASLIHDDVIDEADMRRGKPSVNARWQSKNAVLAGDYILARNMDIGMSSGQYDLVSHIVRTIATLCEGEVMQSDHTARMDTSREIYFDIIRRKTASLISVSASAGAMSAGASGERTAAMRRFGEALGMAFQISDDILDYTSRPSVTGKPANADLREGKITLPLIEVLENVGEERRRELLDMLKECRHDPAKAEMLCRTVESEGGIERAREAMKAYLQRAMSVLAEYEPSPYRESLMNLCAYVAERDR